MGGILVIFWVFVVFWSFFGFREGILVIFYVSRVFWSFFVFLGYLGNFYIWGYFGHFFEDFRVLWSFSL